MRVASHAAAFQDGAAYEATLGPAHRYYIGVKARLVRKIIARYMPAAKEFVDLGCGTGEMAQALTPEGYRVTGVDLSPQMIDYANAKGIPGATFVAGDATRTGLKAAAYDVVFATALFHHVPTLAHGDIAKEMRRLLKPGGLAIVFEHNPLNPITRKIVRDCPVDEGVTLLSSKATAEALRSAGLRPVHRRFLLFFPRPLRALGGLERLLGWCALGGQYVVVAQAPSMEGA